MFKWLLSHNPPLVFGKFNIHFVLNFFTTAASGCYLYKSTIFFPTKDVFWSSKIAKNNKTLQREYNHYIALL